VEAHPHDPIALLETARAELWMERDDAAAELIERLEANSSALETRRHIGFMWLSEGRNARAVEALREVVREKPDDRGRHAFAIALHRVGKNEEALAELEHIGAESELYEEARVAVAELLMREGKLERAEIALRNALAKKPGSAPLLGLLAQLLERKGEVEAAIVLLREAPGDVVSRRKLASVEASILARHDRKDEARRLMSALTYDADSDARHSMASFLWDIGEKKRALDMLAKMATADADAETLNFLGYAYAEENRNLDEAEDLIRRALALSPRSAAVIDSLGWVLYRRGQHAEAERQLRRAYRLSPRDPEIAEHLGDVMRVRGNHKGARTVYREAMDLVRDRVRARDPGAVQHRDRLRDKIAE
jgi:Flp pilus assembly protein TadD